MNRLEKHLLALSLKEEQRKKKKKDLWFNIALFSFLLFIASLSLYFGLKKQEANECNAWSQQAIEYPGFFYTNWQKAQCGIN